MECSILLNIYMKTTPVVNSYLDPQHNHMHDYDNDGLLPEIGKKATQNWRVPDSKVHGANMGPIWGRQDPGGPHVGPMNFAIWGVISVYSNINVPCTALQLQQEILVFINILMTV